MGGRPVAQGEGVDHRKRTNVVALGAAIVVLLGAALVRVATHDDHSAVTAAAGGATSTVPASVLPTLPLPIAPTTAPAARAPTRVTTTVAPSPAATVGATTTTAVDCGKGAARATSTVSADPQADGTYVLTVKIDVINDVTVAIAVDRAVVKVGYPDGSADLVEIASAKGAELQPKETKTFSVSHPTPKPPSTSRVDALDLHAAGQPSCPPKHLQT